jgi:hypothetical protein
MNSTNGFNLKDQGLNVSYLPESLLQEFTTSVVQKFITAGINETAVDLPENSSVVCTSMVSE